MEAASAKEAPLFGVGASLVSVASEFFDVEPSKIFSRAKHGGITSARRAIAHVLMQDVGWSALRVAKFFGQTHPSILTGYSKSQKLMREDPVFHEAVQRMKSEIFHDC